MMSPIYHCSLQCDALALSVHEMEQCKCYYSNLNCGLASQFQCAKTLPQILGVRFYSILFCFFFIYFFFLKF